LVVPPWPVLLEMLTPDAPDEFTVNVCSSAQAT